MDNGGPAFPVYPRFDGYQSKEIVGALGMTLRDYFAAKALQGMLSAENIQMLIGKTITQKDVVGACYEWADAMLETRTPK